MNTLDFSHNWNNKLDCNVFTTIRLSDRLKVGEWVQVTLNTRSKGQHLVLDKRSLKANQLNEWICFLDTGYSLAETRTILNNMYKNRGGIKDDEVIFLYLLRKPNKKEAERFQKEEEARQINIFQQ